MSEAEDKKRRLAFTVGAIQARWGTRALQRLDRDTLTPPPHIPTSFAELDQALGIGGLPRGRISEIVGAPTSGMATTALKVVASAQALTGRQQGRVVYLDLEQTFDPDYAARCGVQLNQMILVRPYNPGQALGILQDFILGGGISVLVCDGPADLFRQPALRERLSPLLARALAPLRQSGCALLFLTSLPPGEPADLEQYPAQVALPHYASVRLLIARERWLYQQQDIRGYEARVRVAKNKLGPAGQAITIRIRLPANPMH